MPWDLWTFVFGMVGALVVLTPAMVLLTRRIRSLSLFSDPRLRSFLDDWFGEPARPGFEARPGVPERLEVVEKRLVKVETDTNQLQRNGGAHLADSIARIEGILAAQPLGGTTVTNVVSPPPPGEVHP